jgi:hypothetical protein
MGTWRTCGFALRLRIWLDETRIVLDFIDMEFTHQSMEVHLLLCRDVGNLQANRIRRLKGVILERGIPRIAINAREILTTAK